MSRHLPWAELQAGLASVRSAPAGEGRLELIVRRPAVDAREVMAEGRLDPEHGLAGDTWRARKVSPNPAKQVTVMNVRLARLVAGEEGRVQLAGDQLYVDLDLSEESLPAGSRLEIGEAMLEVSPNPHLGCEKFAARFGPEALEFVNSEVGRALRLRGLNARVVRAGTVRPGDAVRVVAAAADAETEPAA